MPEPTVRTAAYLKIDSVKGESKVKGHTDEIEVESFSFEAGHGTTAGHGGGLGAAGAAGITDLVIIKRSDSASPALFQALVTGQDLSTATLTATKLGAGSPQGFYTIGLTSAKVTYFKSASDKTIYGDYDPRDMCHLTFTKLEFKYRKQNPDGSLGPESKGVYDVEQLTTA